MGPTLFIMAIMGCGDGEAACRQLRVADALYPTVEACQSAASPVLERNADIDYPVVTVQCRAERAGSARRIQASFPRG
jgi:hypothetical protein